MKLTWILPLVLLFQPIASYAATKASEPVVATLVAEEQSIQPGRPFWVGVELNMDEGWDTYWRNPGDSGFPTQINWQLPEGFTAGPIEWPYPEKFEQDALVAFGYTHSVLLLTEITPPKNLPEGEAIELAADVNWLACKDACVPGEAHLTLDLPVMHTTPLVNDAATTQFLTAKAALPYKMMKKDGKLTVQAQKDNIVLNFKPPAGQFPEFDEALFIPEEGEVVDYTAPQNIERGEQSLSLNVKLANPETNAPSNVKGVLLISEKGTGIKRAIHIDSKVSSSKTHQSGVSGVAVALVLAFFGGLILNVMPCVLPVIALKIFSFVKMAQEKRSVILKHGGVFALGVLVSFWVLSGALLILRAYGEGVGWGFQLQEPMFVAILAGILFLLGLSLFGVFELGTSLISLGGKASSAKSPLIGSFMSGVLATLVATPCTGPLLGPALGFAMTLPPVQALAIFTSMGLGMAFPYLLFSAFPSLVRFLPKPGNWLIVFKQIMGFLMMATVVWLVWVFGAQTDNMATFILLGSLLVMSIGVWIYGKWGTPLRKKLTRSIALGAAILLVGFGTYSSIKAARQYRFSESDTRLVSDSGWEHYSPEKVTSLREQGIPVFVDFTAKWCLICQANKVVLHSGAVQEAFDQKGVVMMEGDWTKKDPVITKELERLGRSGVPVYVLYPGDPSKAPLILPQTLKSGIVKQYLDKIDGARTTVQVD